MIYLLRWFWWRINAYTEIVAMISSLIIAYYFNFLSHTLASWQEIVIGALLTTIIWIIATFITPPDDEETLKNFVKKVNPGGPGWKKFSSNKMKEKWSVPIGLLCMLLGSISVYGALLGVGSLIYGHYKTAALLISLTAVSSFALFKVWFNHSAKTI